MTNELLDDFLSPEEKAYFESGEKQEFEGSVGNEPNDGSDESGADTDADTREGSSESESGASDKDGEPGNEGGEEDSEASDAHTESKRDYEKAFKTERHKRKELKEALEATNRKTQEMEAALAALKESVAASQRPAPTPPIKEHVPDADEDPLGYMQYKTSKLEAQVAQQNQYLQQQFQQQQSQAQESAFFDEYRAKALEFSKTQTDFKDAYAYLLSSKMAEYEAAGFTHQQAQTLLKEDETATVALAKKAGRNPAETIYNVAKSRGYSAKSAQKAANNGQQSKSLADIQKGMANSKSLKSGGGELGDREPGLDSIDGMNFDEFDSYWAKLKKQSKGRL